MKNVIIVKENNCFNFYKISYKRGFKELIDEIKNKYSIIEFKDYTKGYFYPYAKKFLIDDYNFKNIDEFELISCVKHSNTEIYIQNKRESYQTYAGKAKTYIYPVLYKILCQKLDLDLFNNLKRYLLSNDNISYEEKKKILFEIFNYIDFEMFLSLNKVAYYRIKNENLDKDLNFIEFSVLNDYLSSINIKSSKEESNNVLIRKK